MATTDPPRPFCCACRLAFTPVDAKVCVLCEKASAGAVERLTRLIRDYERRYERPFVRGDVEQVIELGDEDIIDDVLERIANLTDDTTDIPSGFNGGR